MKKTLILLILLAFAYGAKAQTFTYKNLTAKDSLKSKYFFLSDGAQNGYILKSDANGKASWQAVPAGGIDSFYLKMVCNISSLEGWKFSSDTIFIDTCYAAVADTSIWSSETDYLQPKDMTKGINSDSGIFILGQRIYTYDNYSNILIGLHKMTSIGPNNISIGESSNYNNYEGSGNICIGFYAATSNVQGADNVYIGTESGYYNVNGSLNNVLGVKSLYNNKDSSNNVSIGSYSGYNWNGSNGLFIHNWEAHPSTITDDTLNSLIYGNFKKYDLAINGILRVKNIPVGTASDSLAILKWENGRHTLKRIANTIPSTSGIASQIADSLASCRSNLSVYNLNSCIGNVIIANDTLKSTKGFLSMKSYTGSSSVPAFGWNDGYGMYRAGSALYLTQGGTNRALFNSVGISCAATAGTPSMRTQGGYSATTPCFVSYNQNTFGMGFSAANTINLITSSKTALQISSAGQSRFGAGATNNITIDTVNAIRLNGSSTVWEDLVVPFTTAVTGSSSYPAFNEDSLYYTFYVDSVSPNDCFKFFIVQMPHRWKEGSNIYPHVHYKHTTAQGTPTFTMRYKWINIGATTAGVPWSYKDLNATTGTTNNTHQMNYTTTPISGTGKTISSILLIRLYLKSQTGSTDINAWQFDLHYEIDSMGSNAEDVK